MSKTKLVQAHVDYDLFTQFKTMTVKEGVTMTMKIEELIKTYVEDNK